MNVVVIPCFDRPEFLTVCLELIKKAHKADQHLYLFQVDFGHDAEVLNVIDAFDLNKEIHHTPIHKYPNKQSYSLLKGYENALKHKPELVYLIEDDVMIANDFFLWHESVISNSFASIATKNHNAQRPGSNDLYATYTMSEYQSLGVCFKADSLQYILNEITDEFYTHPTNFIKRRFPKSHIGVAYSEQDGLIRRLIHEKQYSVCYPEVPRAFHAGYYGKSRGEKPTGSMIDRVNQVKLTIHNPVIMKGDSEPVLLVNPNIYEK